MKVGTRRVFRTPIFQHFRLVFFLSKKHITTQKDHNAVFQYTSRCPPITLWYNIKVTLDIILFILTSRCTPIMYIHLHAGNGRFHSFFTGIRPYPRKMPINYIRTGGGKLNWPFLLTGLGYSFWVVATVTACRRSSGNMRYTLIYKPFVTISSHVFGPWIYTRL